MRDRFASYSTTRALTREAFDAVLNAPVPPALVQAILEADSPAAPLAKRRNGGIAGWLDRLLPRHPASYAGWAVAGAALAVLALPTGQLPWRAEPQNIVLGQARPALASLLETQPSGSTAQQGALRLVALATHPARGTHCRDFAAESTTGQTLGIACRETEGWHVVAAVTLPGGQRLRPASADDPLLATLLERIDAGAPLSAAAEAALIARGWR
jgi:hypothetical protein